MIAARSGFGSAHHQAFQAMRYIPAFTPKGVCARPNSMKGHYACPLRSVHFDLT